MDWSNPIVVLILTNILAIVGASWKISTSISNKLTLFGQILKEQGNQLAQHSNRMEGYEHNSFKMVSDLQRLVGRVETMNSLHVHRREDDE